MFPGYKVEGYIRMRQPSTPQSYWPPAFVQLLGMLLLLWLGACAEPTVDYASWIQIGKTTKKEVVARYGEPDLVLTGQDGETVTYRPAPAKPAPVQIPTATPGPFGTMTTQTQTIEPGLGKDDKSSRRPQKEMRIRYDSQGIVQDVQQ